MKSVHRKMIYLVGLGMFIWIGYLLLIRNMDNTPYKQVHEEVNQNGFKIVKTEEVDTLHGTAITYEHIQSGGKLIYIKNDDKERYFSINVKALPTDNTGENHVIEHCVARGGSAHYPIKNLLEEIKKNTMSESIIACTQSDYVTYSASSYMEQDIHHMLDVMLDMVFFSDLTTEPKLFEAERGAYTLASKDDPIEFSGRVYSEMKGMEGPHILLNRTIERSLLPDTVYQWTAGGIPEDIMKLKREDMIRTYKENYKPSNCYMLVYGELDIEQVLKKVDKYYSQFRQEKQEVKNSCQTSFTEPVVYSGNYGIFQEQDSLNKTYLAFNYVISTVLDSETVLSFQVLDHMLQQNIAQLNQDIMNKQLGGLVETQFSLQSFQPIYSIIVHETEEKNKKAIQELIQMMFESICNNGLDNEQVESSIKHFKMKERNTRLNSTNMIKCNNEICRSWIHGGDPFAYIKRYDHLITIEEKSKSKYFENLIIKYLTHNTHMSTVALKPVKGLLEKRAEENKKNLEAYKATLTSQQLEDLINKSQDLSQWKKKVNASEALAILPSLSLDDIDLEMDEIPLDVKQLEGTPILYYPLELDGITQLSMYFDTKNILWEQLSYVRLISELLGKLETRHYTLEQVKDGIEQYGWMSIPRFIRKPDTSDYSLKLHICSKNSGIDRESISFLSEILTHTKWDDKEVIKKMIHEQKEALEMALASYDFGSELTHSHVANYGEYYSKIWSTMYYGFLKELDANFEEKWCIIQENLETISHKIFNRHQLMTSFAGNQDNYNDLVKYFPRLIQDLNSTIYKEQEYVLTPYPMNKGIILPINTYYIVKGGNFIDEGYNYDPKMKVLETILNNTYMEQVALEGQAYGATCRITKDGQIIFSVDRGSTITSAIEAIDRTIDFIKNFSATEKEMKKHIMNTIPLILQRGRFKNFIFRYLYADEMYFTHDNIDHTIKACYSILHTKDDDIRRYADMIEKVLHQNHFCVAGGEEAIQDTQKIFDEVVYFQQD